jgi:iron complex outermembrane recepter protein
MYITTNSPRWQLLTTVSAVALLGSLGVARADDAGRPILWIEAGGQLEQLSDKQEPYAPPFVAQLLDNPFTPPAAVQAPPRFSFGEEARITFQPEDSEWKFSAALRYGRANRSGNSHEETSPASPKAHLSIPYFHKYGTGTEKPAAKRFATTVAQNHQNNTILDFNAGKDVGLGMFAGSSTLSMGARFAQFSSRSSVRIDSDPDFTVSYKYITHFAGHPANIKIPQQSWDLYIGRMTASRSFRGLGPSLQWDGSTTVAGHADSGAITFDWGLNGAVLFGRQTMKAHHQTTAHHGSPKYSSGPLPLAYQAAHDTARSRSVTVPNVGGFAGLSLRFPNAKISLGYRADMFIGAMDGGIDTRKTYDRNFYGPFASISVGLGD